jgi:predicted component of type VI protein secretion system
MVTITELNDLCYKLCKLLHANNVYITPSTKAGVMNFIVIDYTGQLTREEFTDRAKLAEYIVWRIERQEQRLKERDIRIY